MSARIVCGECIKKQEQIYRLKEENKRLKAKLRIQERKITEGYFGSATPSSKKPVKQNSLNNGVPKNRGGAKLGHNGNGRRAVSAEQADRVELVTVACRCPQCHGSELELLDRRERTVIDYEIKRVKIVYQLERKRCQACGSVIQAKAPGVLPKHLYSNNLLVRQLADGNRTLCQRDSIGPSGTANGCQCRFVNQGDASIRSYTNRCS